jgi:hypothetical protein
MRKVIKIVAVAGLVLASSASASQLLSISQAESAGFEKNSQQLFQMIGAKDGWSGTWSGEKVELYQFASEEQVNPKVFESSVQEGNISGWVELCQHLNMLMLSKGEKACGELKSLDP